MARLLARAAPGCDVTGADLRSDYIAYAEGPTSAQTLPNLAFQVADVLRLPWPDASFDLVWSTYLLQWLEQPERAIAEFRRVLKLGGVLVCCNFDGFGVTHHPPDLDLQQRADLVFSRLIDPFIRRKMGTMFLNAGLENIVVDMEQDRLFTVIGAIDPERRRHWEDTLAAARPYIAEILGGDAAADEFIQEFLGFQDNPNTCSYTGLFFAKGTRADSPESGPST